MDAYHKYKHYRLPQLLARIEHLEAELRIAKAHGTNSAPAPKPVLEKEQQDSSPSASTSALPQSASAGADPVHDQPENGPGTPWTKTKKPAKLKKKREFDFSRMPVRKIALRFAYDGEDYSGLASQGDGIPTSQSSANAFFAGSRQLPTVELILWNALCATHLVDPSQGFRGAGWSRSGRTDSGVSAAGQVVSFWIRSNKVDERDLRRQEEERVARKNEKGEMVYVFSEGEEDEFTVPNSSDASGSSSQPHDPWTNSPLQEGVNRDEKELDYVVAINRLLPPSIRILSWSPVRPSFNARYHTRYRHYKYFFHSGPPAFLLPPKEHKSHRTTPPRLDIAAMQEAASYLLGEHDFRNMCKVDPSKQIVNFRRRIDGVSIDRVESGWPLKKQDGTGSVDRTESSRPPSEDAENMYVFNLRGTAFLYHQVRDIMAVLLLVGAGLERPSIVKELLNVEEGAWDHDKKWLLDAGVRYFGDVNLPRGTATEVDGATAAAPYVQAQEAVQSDTAPESKIIHDEAETSSATHTPTRTRAIAEDVTPTVTYPRKPEYVMAMDRPLVLWECGYRPKDVSWRSGSYDGPLSPEMRASIPVQGDEALITSAARTFEDVYETWCQRSISTEIWRHFTLAAGTSVHGGTYGSGTLYQDARWPYFSNPVKTPFLAKAAAAGVQGQEETTQTYPRMTMALGHGSSKPLNAWKGVRNLKLQETPEVKYKKYLDSRGGNGARAGKKQTKQQNMEGQQDETQSLAQHMANVGVGNGEDNE